MAGKKTKKSATRDRYKTTDRKAKNKIRRLTKEIKQNPNNEQAKTDLARWENKCK